MGITFTLKTPTAVFPETLENFKLSTLLILDRSGPEEYKDVVVNIHFMKLNVQKSVWDTHVHENRGNAASLVFVKRTSQSTAPSQDD